MINLIKKLFSNKIIRFLFVGVLNTVVWYAIYYLQLKLGINYILSNVIAYILATIHSYLWNKFFTFKTKEQSKEEIIRFILVCFASLAIGSCTLYLWVSILGIDKSTAGIINMFVTTIINWFGHNYFSFKN